MNLINKEWNLLWRSENGNFLNVNHKNINDDNKNKGNINDDIESFLIDFDGILTNKMKMMHFIKKFIARIKES
jgi:hypothetical protein